MGLIDSTYFVGEINIPNSQLANSGVPELLATLIEVREPEFLRKVLGYELSRDFITGLSQLVIDPKWTNLLQGVEYTDMNGRLNKWNGLLQFPGSNIIAIDAIGNKDIVVDRGQQYDPISDSSTTIIPANLVGKPFSIEQRNFGTLRVDEYSIAGNVLTLGGGRKFISGDTYFYRSTYIAINTTNGIIKKSPIANYVYWHYMTNNHTQTSAMGEVKGSSENAQSSNPTLKLVQAWNQMSECLCDLWLYLDTNYTVYTQWEQSRQMVSRQHFGRTNQFGI